MNKIYILLDYKNRIGSKQRDVPYRSGMDKTLITNYFKQNGYETCYINYPDIRFRSKIYKNKFM